MPTNDDLLRLRRMTGEYDPESDYTDTDLDIFIAEANGDLNDAAAAIWGEKASNYADLVNISEAGSSRSNSDLFEHATAQQQYFASRGAAAAATAPSGSSTTRPIVRQ